MSDIITDDLVEMVAKAVADRNEPTPGRNYPDGFTVLELMSLRDNARAALAAALPVIGERIATAVENINGITPDGDPWDDGYAYAREEDASAIRSLTTPKESDR